MNASTLLKEARRRAGMTRAHLARDVGVSRSLITMYEGGKREPGVESLRRLIRATGSDLGLRPASATLDDERSARILSEVIQFAETFPYKSRGLRFPPFRTRIR